MTAEGIPPFVARSVPPPVLGASPALFDRTCVEHPEESEPGPDAPALIERASRAELDIRGAFLTDDRSVGRARPEIRGGGAVVCVRYRAFEVEREWQRVCGW